MTFTEPTPADRQAHRESVQLSDPELVYQLRELLGFQLVADIGGVKETRAVRQWADGERKPSVATMGRLRSTYLVAAILHEHYPVSVVQAWFLGINPELGDTTPVVLFRDGPLEEKGPAVLSAARSFLPTGGSDEQE